MPDDTAQTLPETRGMLDDDPSVELSSNRTAMSFERTRMSADRTLMSVLRTSLSLISFGFTIFQFFQKLAGQVGSSPVTHGSARRFGLALVVLGVGMLIAGLYSHTRIIMGLRDRRDTLKGLELLHSGPQYRTSPTAVSAVLLLLIGLLAVLGMTWRSGPFG